MELQKSDCFPFGSNFQKNHLFHKYLLLFQGRFLSEEGFEMNFCPVFQFLPFSKCFLLIFSALRKTDGIAVCFPHLSTYVE